MFRNGTNGKDKDNVSGPRTYLRGHPVRSAHNRVRVHICLCEFCGDSKVGKFDQTLSENKRLSHENKPTHGVLYAEPSNRNGEQIQILQKPKLHFIYCTPYLFLIPSEKFKLQKLKTAFSKVKPIRTSFVVRILAPLISRWMTPCSCR